MIEQRVDNQALVPPGCPQSRCACCRSATAVGGLASVMLLAARDGFRGGARFYVERAAKNLA